MLHTNKNKCCNKRSLLNFTKSTKFVGLILSLIEWYDFAIFAALVNVISSIFFNNTNQWLSLLYGFISFAIGYFLRPIGAGIFGRIADKYGSLYSLKYSTLLMTIGTFGISFIPLSSINIAIILLGFFRMLQGLALGGCYGVSYAHVSLNTEQGYKNRALAFVCIGFLLGFIAGNTTVGLVSYIVKDNLYTYGWRVPFFIGGFNSLLVFLFLNKLKGKTDTKVKADEKNILRSQDLPKAENNNKEKTLSINTSKKFNWEKIPLFIKSISLISIDMIGFHIFFVFNATYSILELGANQTSINIQNSILMIILIPIIWLFGLLSDKTSEKFTLSLSAIMFVVLSFIFPWTHSYELLLGVLMLGACYGSLPNLIVSQFDKSDVNYFTGLSFNIASAIFAGLTPVFATILSQYSLTILRIFLLGIGLVLLPIIFYTKKRI